MEKKYDVAIIGAGPGGYVAGIRAAQLGLKICVVEKDNPGGVCLNWGCIPSKNLIHQAGLFSSMSELSEIGVNVDVNGLDYGKVHEKSRQVVRRLRQGVEFLMQKNKIDYVQGDAKISDKNTVSLSDGRDIVAKNIIVATGSRPLQLPGFEFDEEQVLSSTGVLSMDKLPKSMAILGAGAVGCEFAYVMNALGVEITLVELADHILPFEDEEVVAVLASAFEKTGIRVLTGCTAKSLVKSAKQVDITLQEKEEAPSTISAEKVLCVFGRQPNTDYIGLGNIGIATEKGFIPVDDYNQTVVPGVFAIGDVVATPLLAHVASKEGENVVEYIAGKNPEPRIDLGAIPSAIYCQPQVASFGLREAQANKDGIPFKKAIFPYIGVGKAVAVGKTDGMVKVLYDPDTEEILGSHIVGANATEMIHELLLAKTSELVPSEVANMIHAHPTLSESIMENMKMIEGGAIHI